MLKLLVVEDHPLIREGLVQTLHKLDADVELHEAQDGEEAIELLDEVGEVDLVLLDLILPGMSGISVLTVMRKRFPMVPVVVLSALDDPETVQRALKHGAAGFIPKTNSSEYLLNALRIILDGGEFVPDSLTPVRAAPPSDAAKLRPLAARFGVTKGQERVLEMLVQGKSNQEIAELLELSEGTVKVHLSRIFKTMNVGSRAQAIAMVNKKRLKL